MALSAMLGLPPGIWVEKRHLFVRKWRANECCRVTISSGDIAVDQKSDYKNNSRDGGNQKTVF